MKHEEKIQTRGTLQDNRRESYPYILTVIDDFYDWRIHHYNLEVGKAWCVLAGDEFRLQDWGFEREVVVSIPPFWARWLGHQPEVRDYRRRGLGRGLLPKLISQARLSGAKRMTGLISPSDLQEFPTLPGWYGRFGFIYAPFVSDGNFSGKIELVL